jgi:hypothetical protein
MNSSKINNNSKELAPKNVAVGWFCLFLGILTWIAASRFIIPVWQAITGPQTGSTGTTVGMGMGIGMPFIVAALLLTVFGWIILLRNRSKIYSLILIALTTLIIVGFSNLVWHASILSYRSPLTQAVEKYSTYDAISLVNELKTATKRYENPNIFQALFVHRYPVEVQALMQLLVDKYPVQAKKVLEEIETTSTNEKIKKMALNYLKTLKKLPDAVRGERSS